MGHGRGRRLVPERSRRRWRHQGQLGVLLSEVRGSHRDRRVWRYGPPRRLVESERFFRIHELHGPASCLDCERRPRGRQDGPGRHGNLGRSHDVRARGLGPVLRRRVQQHAGVPRGYYLEMDSVQIRDAPNGRGTALGNRTYYPGEKDTFYAASYNRTSGFRGDVVGHWTSDDPAVCQVWGFNQNGSSLELLLKSPGTCRVKVDV